MKASDKSWKATLVRLLPIVLIIASSIATYSYTFDKKLDFNGDNAKYIELARSLAGGHGFATEGIKFQRIPHTHFPPGYPVLLALPMVLGIDSLIALKILNGLFMLAALLLFYGAIVKSSGHKEMALAVCILSAAAPTILHFATIVMSEMSFMFFMMLALFSMVKTSESEKTFGPWFWTTAFCAIACYYIRAAGSAVILSMLAFYLFRKEWKRAGTSLATVIICYLPWFVRNKIVGNQRSYLSYILARNPWRPEEGNITSVSEFFGKIWTNLDETTLRGFIRIFHPTWTGFSEKPSALPILLGILILAVVLFGLWSNKKMRFALLALLLGNIGLLLIWNGGNGIRYVTPFIPLVIYGFWNGVYSLIEIPFKAKAREKMKPLAYASLLSLVLIIPALKNMHAYAKSDIPEAYRHYFELATALDSMSSRMDKSVVACRKPELFKYYSPNTIPVFYPSTQDDKELIKGLIYDNVDYVVLDQLGFSSTARYLWPAIQSNQKYFRPVLARQPEDDSKRISIVFKFDRELATKELL